jgi:hypothetical protein
MTRFVLALTFLLTACLDEATELDLAEVELEATVPTPVITLTDDAFVTATLGANTIKYYKLEVPAGFDRVSVYRNGFTSACTGFYMRRNQIPSPTNYDCTSTSMGCGVDMPIAGTYYIAVYAGSQSYTNITFAAGYRNKFTPISNNYSQTYYNQYGIDRQYKLIIPSNASGATFTYTLDPTDGGSIDLVVKRNAFANDQNYDCIKWIDGYEGLTHATCSFTNPTPGTYYIALLGHHTKVVGTFTARYRFALVNAPATSSL